MRWVKSEAFVRSGRFGTGKASALGFGSWRADGRGGVAAGFYPGGRGE